MLEKVGFTLFLVAGALAIAGQTLGFPWLFRLAIVVVGLVACVAGLRSLFTGEAVEGRTQISTPHYVRRFSGLSARLIGAALLLIGLLIIGLGSIDLLNPGAASTFLAGLVESSYGLALILGLAGLIILAFGFVRILSGSGASPEAYGPFVEFGIRLGGVVSALAGLALLLLAVASILAPGLLQSLFERVLHLAKSWLLNQS